MSRREEILLAISEAATIVGSYPPETRTSFDLITVIDDMDIPVIFRPLDSLLGASITIEDKSGILVNSQRNRQVQRFTLAHELGHILLGHENQVDKHLDVFPRDRDKNSPPQERAAEMFASKLLAHDDLLFENIRRQGWNKGDLSNSEIIYQLSLRLGLSFKATCWALNEASLLDRGAASDLANEKGIVKTAKESVAPATVDRDPWADVWYLTKRDSGTEIETSSRDIFVVQLEDNAGSGYVWDIQASSENFEIVSEELAVGEKYGSSTTRQATIQLGSMGRHVIQFKHLRPWNEEVLDEFEVIIDNRGHEDVGEPRRIREKSLAKASV